MNTTTFRLPLLSLGIIVATAAACAAVPYTVTSLGIGIFSETLGYGISATQQVGYGNGPSQTHALLWSGTPASVVDLHPAAYLDSQAYGVSGGQQVGRGL